MENNHTRQTLYKINELATEYYQDQLSKSKEAQEYLKQRNINKDSIKEFKIGYAPVENKLYNYLVSQGYTSNCIEETKLFAKSKDNNIQERFCDRIIFPKTDVDGRIVAFGARAINEKIPKFLISPESRIYEKSQYLYGLNIAKDYAQDGIIIVEGYFDVITLNQIGIKNVVALLDRVMTESQINLIKKYTNNIILAFDNDLAGKQATLDAIELIQNSNMNSKVVRLEEAEDPDEYVNKFESDKFKEVINSAISSFEYEINCLLDKYDTNDTYYKIAFLKEVIKLLKKVRDTAEQEFYIEKISKRFGVSQEAIIEEVKKIL